ncbi:MAG: tetratricopeptide repeat protein [Myxococcota bacterium]
MRARGKRRCAWCLAVVIGAGSLIGAGSASGCGGAGKTAAPDEWPPADPEALRAMGEGARLMRRERWSEARSRFEQALQIDPQLWEARYNLGVLEWRAGNLDAARTMFSAIRMRYEAAAGSMAVVWIAEAEVCRVLGERAQAMDLLRAVIRAEKRHLEARAVLVTLLREAGEYEDALVQARQVLVREPEHIGALVEVGRIHREQGQFEVSQLVLRKALDLAHEREDLLGQIHNDLGLLELAREEPQAAFEEFTAAVERDPDNASAQKNRGALLLRAGNYEAALQAYRAALRTDASDLSTRIGIAICLRGLARYLEAEAEYDRLLTEHPEHLEGTFNLAILRAEFLEARTDAIELFERFLRLAPRQHPGRAVAERYLSEIQPAGDGV